MEIGTLYVEELRATMRGRFASGGAGVIPQTPSNALRIRTSDGQIPASRIRQTLAALPCRCCPKHRGAPRAATTLSCLFNYEKKKGKPNFKMNLDEKGINREGAGCAPTV
jgi:hypothetical protein